MGTIEVFCNPAMVALLEPIRKSAVVLDSYGYGYLVAEYDEAELKAVPEDLYDFAVGYPFWRYGTGLNIEVPYNKKRIKTIGLIGWIWEQGITTERHVAGAIADLAYNAGLGQIEFMNWAARFVPERIVF